MYEPLQPVPSEPTLSPAEVALEAAIRAGNINRHRARNHRPTSITSALRHVDLFRAFVGRPLWEWTPAHMDAYSAGLYERGCALETIRNYQGDIRRYLASARDDAYSFNEQCWKLTGKRIPQICTIENTVVHQHGAPTSKRRNLTPDEMRAISAALVRRIERPRRAALKPLYQMFYAALNLMLGSGARGSELQMADTADLHPAITPAIQAYSPFEDFLIRFGKSHDGGPPKRRFVPATYHFRNQWQIVGWYLCKVRPKLIQPPSGDALFINSVGQRLNAAEFSRFFKDLRDEAGVSSDITLHCMRHTYWTRLHESGLEATIGARLLGHVDERTSGLYDHMGSDSVKRRILASNRRILEKIRACHSNHAFGR